MKSVREQRVVPRAAAVVCLLACLFGVWSAARDGVSRLFSDYAADKLVLPAADAAVRLNPSDPEAHYARAVVLSETEQPAEAANEFRRAVALRPEDYFLWFEFGRTLDQTGDSAAALEAFRQAARLAPYYAQPRWQAGNLLLRTGRLDEAFDELRRAAASDTTLLPALLDLSWSASGGDAGAVEQAVGAQGTETRLQLARFLARHGATDAALRIFREAGGGADNDSAVRDRRALLAELLAQKRFREAYEVWAGLGADAARAPRGERPAAAIISDGGFEGAIRLDEAGFGWQVRSKVAGVRIALDDDAPRTGARSLRIDFDGASAPSTPLVSQLVIVDAATRYRLSFAARTRDIVTGGRPFVSVLNPGGAPAAPPLAQSKPLPSGTGGWQAYMLEFETPKGAEAVLITVQRRSCPGGQCPAFGSVWLDDFTLVKL